MELSKHCLTRETLLDTIISCASCILRFPLFRDHHPTFKPYGPNLSSRFSEYGFRFSRKNMQMLSSRGFMLAFTGGSNSGINSDTSLLLLLQLKICLKL